MKIAIGTRNEAKNKGIRLAIEEARSAANLWSGQEIEFAEIEVDSGVAAQPMTTKEGYNGAYNRAKAALAETHVDIGIGAEGYVHLEEWGAMLGSYVVIVDKNGKCGIGCSSLITLPESISMQLQAGAELGPLIQNMFDDADNAIRKSIGTNGVLSKGTFKRDTEFYEAARNALIPFLNPEHY